MQFLYNQQVHYTLKKIYIQLLFNKSFIHSLVLTKPDKITTLLLIINL